MIVIKKRGCSDKINEYLRYMDFDCRCHHECNATMINVNMISSMVALTEMLQTNIKIVNCFKCQHQVADTYDKITSDHLCGEAITLQCPDHIEFSKFESACRLLFPMVVNRKPQMYCYSNRR